MAKSAEEIIADWRKRRPSTVPKKEVEIVVEKYFPKSHRYVTKTSHWLIITDTDLRQAQQGGYNTGTIDGVLSLSLVEGKYVKKYLIDNLLDAIDIKQQIEELRNNR